MKNKSFVLFCALSLSLVLSCCGNSLSGDPPADAPSSQKETDAGSSSPAQEDGSAGQDISSDSQAVLEWEGLTVTAGPWDPDTLTLSISAENTDSRPVTLQAASCWINNYMQTPDFSLNVEAESSASGLMTFSRESFSISGIDQAETIGFTPVVLDGTDFSVLHTATPAVISTGLPSGEAPEHQGQTLYDENGIRILYLGPGEDSQWGMDFLLFIENNSGRDLAFETENCRINGHSLNPLFSSMVSNGKKSVAPLSFFSEELEDSQITEALSLSFDMKLLDPKTYETTDILPQLSPQLTS